MARWRAGPRLRRPSRSRSRSRDPEPDAGARARSVSPRRVTSACVDGDSPRIGRGLLLRARAAGARAGARSSRPSGLLAVARRRWRSLAARRRRRRRAGARHRRPERVAAGTGPDPPPDGAGRRGARRRSPETAAAAGSRPATGGLLVDLAPRPAAAGGGAYEAWLYDSVVDARSLGTFEGGARPARGRLPAERRRLPLPRHLARARRRQPEPLGRQRAAGAAAQAGRWPRPRRGRRRPRRRARRPAVGLRPTRTPFASSASAFAWAVPFEPETIAPAWPIVLPGGAVKPAM